MWVYVAVAMGIVLCLFGPLRWLRVWMARASGVPKELVSEALGESNSSVVSFDDEKITALRRSDGASTSVRWHDLSEIYFRLTDTGPNENDAYLMLADRDSGERSILLGTEGLTPLLTRMSAMHWFSQPQLDAAVAAIKGRQLGVCKFLLWTAERDGVAIPMGFSEPSSSGGIECDDETIRFTPNAPCSGESGGSRGAQAAVAMPAVMPVVIRWSELSEVQMVLEPTDYNFRFVGAGAQFSASVLTDGFREFLAKIREMPRFELQADAQEEAVDAIRNCSLKQLVYTIYRAAAV